MSTGYQNYRTLPQEPKFLHGTPGTIYILQNDGLRPGLYRIGATRRSGVSKAMEFNRDTQNMLPGTYECVFELHAKDCGAALEVILRQFETYRHGKKNLDFYQLDLEQASNEIVSIIADINTVAVERAKSRQQHAPESMRHLLPDLEPANHAVFNLPPPSFLKKAFEWVAN
ncbi:hypothetical protein [Undibacterium sp. SXout20W]|uniref:hypothetical protein n=1 Tax=Undibacterium sp. SXout20W TaxID=3413051 RepID=UPI003BF03781